jgi:hypothetical protein
MSICAVQIHIFQKNESIIHYFGVFFGSQYHRCMTCRFGGKCIYKQE